MIGRKFFICTCLCRLFGSNYAAEAPELHARNDSVVFLYAAKANCWHKFRKLSLANELTCVARTQRRVGSERVL